MQASVRGDSCRKQINQAYNLHTSIINTAGQSSFVAENVNKPYQLFLLYQRIKIKLRAFIQSSEHINEKRGWVIPWLLSLFSDPIDLATWSQRELL